MTEKNRPDYYKVKMISNSGLKLFKDNSPFKALHLLDTGIKETTAIIEGRAVHKAVLEPDDFFDEFEYIPEKLSVTKTTKKYGKVTTIEPFNMQKKVFQDAKNAIIERGKTPLTPDQKVMVDGICNRIFSSKMAQKLLIGEPEKEYYGELFGEKFKIKVDMVNEEKGFISDLKTCLDSSPESMIKDIFNRDYDQQGWIYPEVASQFSKKPINHFFFINIEKVPPYAMSIIEMNKDQKAIGQLKAEHHMALYKLARKNPTKDNDTYPEGQKHFQYDIPAWMVRKYDIENEQ